MNQADLVRNITLNVDKFSWFLGAGSSDSANLPTANDIIWDLKKKYYCSEENQDIRNQDIQLLPIRRKIQEYMDSKGFPAKYDDDEYSFYFELYFGREREAQRKYLADILSMDNAALSIGHRALAALMSDGKANVVYTTNFGKVIENAYSFVCGKDLGSFHLEGAAACISSLNNDGFPLYAKIHGDFQYQKLSNLEEDLLKADEHIRECFIASSSRFGTVVTGYSGRDQCVMELFDQACSVPNAFPHGLYWTIRKSSGVDKRVEQLISKAKSNDVDAQIVEIDSFDALMARLWRNLPERKNNLDIKVQRIEEQSVVIPMPKQNKNGSIIRFNAIPITDFPKKCYAVKADSVNGWKELKIIERASKGKLLCWIDKGICVWGEREEIEKHFPEGAKISELDISEKIINLENHNALQASLEELVCMSISKRQHFINRKNTILISEDHFNSLELNKLKTSMGQLGGKLPTVQFTDRDGSEENITPLWSLSIHLKIRKTNQKYLLMLSPDISISPPKVRKQCIDFVNSKRRLWKNDKMDEVLSAWIKSVFIDEGRMGVSMIKLALEIGDGKDFNIKVANRTAYSKEALRT